MYTVFILWITLLPFISFAGAFEGPKVMWFWVGGLLLTLYHAVIVWQKKASSIDPKLAIFSLWAAVLGASSVVGIHPVDSFLGGSYRHQGVLFFFTLILLARVSKTLHQKQLNVLYICGSVAGFVESVLVVYQSFVQRTGRPIGTLGEPNAVAGFLALSMYWIVCQRSYPIVLRTSVSILMAGGVLLTQSRAGIGMIVSIVVLYGIGRLFRTRFSAVKTGIILGGISSVLLVGFVLYRSITTVREVSQFENRSMFFRVGVEEFMKRPFLGYGAESGEAVYDNHFARISMPLADYMIDRSHNVFLDVALWSGAIGLLIFICWLVYSAYDIYKTQDFLRLSFIVGWVVFACVQPVGVVHWVHLILFLYIPAYKHEQ